MLLPIESIAEGTWGSGPWPDELVIADLLLETKWTWTDLQATPTYIQRVVIDTIQARRGAEKAEIDRHQHEQEARRRHGPTT